MHKVLKALGLIMSICAIFTVIFVSNLWLDTQNIQNTKKIKNTLTPAQLELCEKQAEGYSMALGCIKEEFGVGSYLMYLSAPLFVFLSLLLFKSSKKYLYLTPMLTIVWLVLSESVVRIFKIPVTHTVPMEGDIRVLDGLYFQFYNGNELILFFIFFASAIAGLLAYSASLWIRKFIITSHNSA